MTHMFSFSSFKVPVLIALAFTLAVLPGAEARVTTASSVEQAKERASKSKKDYLVLNYGEWDGYSSDIYKNCWKPTKHLDKALESSTILTEAVFGDDLTDAQKKAQERRNKGLNKTPPSLPSVFFFDQDGFHYATLTGSAVPAEETQFALAVGEIQKKRIKRDEIIKEAMLKKGLERAKLLGTAGDIEGIKVSPKLLDLVKAADPGDQSGYIRRLTFDIFNLHRLLKEPEDKAHKELDRMIADEGYSIEQRQAMLGLKNFIYRKNPAKNEKLIIATYEKMYKLGPDTIMGRSGKKGLQGTFDIGKISGEMFDKPVKDAISDLDKILADTSFPYSVEQKQDILELKARCMLPKVDEYKDEIVETYKKIIDLAPQSQMAQFAQQEIDFLTLSKEELDKRQRMSLDDIDRDELLGEEIYPDDEEE